MPPADAAHPADFLGLRGRRILVTGASSGIGRSVAIAASREGAYVALLGRDRQRLNNTRDEMAGSGHVVGEYDLRDLDGIPAQLQSLAAELGGLDVLVHAAGVHSGQPLRSLALKDLEAVFASNVYSAFVLAKAFRNKRINKVRPSIVFVSSVMAAAGQPGVSAYAASKGAISTATRSLSIELAPEGIRVNCVEPGIVETEMTGRIRVSVGEVGFSAIEKAHPLGLGRPEDVANAILFLISDAARWITGTSLVVDGGYLAQ